MGNENAPRDAPTALLRKTSSSKLEVRNISKRYGGADVLKDINLEVEAGSFLTILGPSGSGKTTLLKIIAGFEESSAGSIILAGKDTSRTDASRRNIGMVFQSYALFPHMTVSQNAAFPLRMRGVPKKEIKERVAEVLSFVGLEGMAERLPNQLSGGQQQRVALARAVVFRPALLLMDEPFSALDRKLRETMQLEVRRLQQQLGLTTLFITHDQEEALLMSDHIAVLSEGEVQQFGRPHEIYEKPSNAVVADFIGESNLFCGEFDNTGDTGRLKLDDGTTFHIDPSSGSAAFENLASAVPSRCRAWAILRPERLFDASQEDGLDTAFNVIEGRILETVYVGNSSKYRIRTSSGLEVLARLDPTRTGRFQNVGETLRLGFHARDLRVVKVA